MEGFTARAVADWCVPIILGFGLHYLAKISDKLAQLGEALAAMAVKVEETDRRLQAVEDRENRERRNY